MPELPEVETVKEGLQSLINQKIAQVKIFHFGLRYKIDPKLPKILVNQTVSHIYRRAKYLILKLNNGYLIIHLGMSGSISLYDNKINGNQTYKKHDHVVITFAKQTLIYNDPRRFGAILYTNLDPNSHPLIKKLGVEPLEKDFNAKYLANKLKGKNSSIKQTIMNNHIVVGVGNIYACEALFLAKISPTKLAKDLTQNDITILVKTIKQVLALAIKMGGSSLKDYKKTDSSMGYFQTAHNVYGKANTPCPSCSTLISQKRIGQRNSFFCTKCQK